MPESAPILRRVREILAISGDRVGKARRISAAIREAGGYRRVGIYDVAAEGEAGAVGTGAGGVVETGVVAWSGPALSTTRSKLVVPVQGRAGGGVLGLLGVESDIPDAFSQEDQRCLEACAAILAPLWG